MSKLLRTAALAATACLGLGTTGALADGYETAGSLKDTMPAPVDYEWNGLSVGAGIGVGQLNQDAFGKAWRKDDDIKKKICEWEWWKYKGKFVWDCDQYYKNDKYSELKSGAEGDNWNVFGTIQIGYDRLLTDRILIGAFTDFDFYTDADLTFSDKSHKGSLVGSVDRENIWTAGGRIGFLATPRVLIYGLAGYSQMKLDGSLSAEFDDPLNGPHPTNASLKLDERVDGWTVGGGVEAKLEKRLSLKVEYRYSQFDGLTISEDGKRDGDFSFWKHHKYYDYERTIKEGGKLDLGDTDVHSVRAVLSFKLGRDEVPVAPLK